MASPATPISSCSALSARVSRSYETFPQIPKDRSNDPTKSNFYGGGVEDEHFIVWMRLAGFPRFRKLYGRLEGGELRKGDVVQFEVQRNFEVSTFRGRKALVLATENGLGGKNYGLGIAFAISAGLSFVLVLGVIIAGATCPR